MSDVVIKKKKILENTWASSIVVPVAIILVGSLVIFGVTKMLSTDQSYKDLVNELQSKTFGNKWVAAYELSKQINSKKIPKEDMPWLVNSLKETYKTTVDARTRNFIVVAAAALKNQEAVEILELGLKDTDAEVQFSAVAGLGNLPQEITFDFNKLKEQLQSTDDGLKQAIIYTMATHKFPESQGEIFKTLESAQGTALRFAAAIALITFKDERAIPTLKEIFIGDYQTKPDLFKPDQVTSLKLNVLNAMQKEKWTQLGQILSDLIPKVTDEKMKIKIIEALNQLKN